MSDDDWSDDNEWEDDEYLEPDLQHQLSYELIQESEIIKRQAQAIEKLADEIGLQYSQAAVLLIQNQWNPQQVIEKILNSTLDLPFFSRSSSKSSNFSQPQSCILCFNQFPGSNFRSLECNHSFCQFCYKEYLKESVLSGAISMFTKCPWDDCQLIVSEDLFKELLPKQLFDRYKMFIIRSYVEKRADLKWCPSPDCKCAVSYPKKKSREIQCSCGYSWCFGCGKESHRPLSCELLTKWGQRLVADDTEQWLLANTKTCPKCLNAIQKNLGCMHMTCKCGHQFCWLCLGDWNEHGGNTGGFYQCNKFKLEQNSNKQKAEEKKRTMAAVGIQRFEHYFNRFLNHKASINTAKEKLKKIEFAVKIMYGKINEGHIFDFFSDAAILVMNTKKSLAYSYALGYFLTSPCKLRFYEFIQGELESNMILLDKMLETNLLEFIDESQPWTMLKPEFTNFRMNVITVSDVVKKYFDECLIQMEAGFPEVNDLNEDDEDKDYLTSLLSINTIDRWICGACTLANELNVRSCVACGTVRLA